MEGHLGLVALGFTVGALGTLIGAGGGFILVPVLLLLNPAERPEAITSISLAVVFLNALSGSWAYARMGRIDYRSGWLFALATVPGAIAGALTTDHIPRRAFNGVFGVLMVAAALYLLTRRERAARAVAGGPGLTLRTVVDRAGQSHTYAYSLRLGLGLSVFVGYLSSLLGIGGGIIHVPALVRLLNFPVHLATATSHLVLAVTACAGTLVHVATGALPAAAAGRIALLGAGALVGAQAGARLSTRLHGRWILRCLAVALGLVGIRILLMALRG